LTKTTKWLIPALALLATGSVLADHRDNFQRTDLGPGWFVVSGSDWDTGKSFQGDTGSTAIFRKADKDTGGQIDVDSNNGDLVYGAILLGDVRSGNNAFVKVQSQNGYGTFDTAAFYTGNNGGGYFFSIDGFDNTTKVRLSAWMHGTVATMFLESPTGHSAVYQYDYGMSFPSGVGLGTYGSVSLDRLHTLAIAGGMKGTLPPRATAQDSTLK
jgi:hypothetical protein